MDDFSERLVSLHNVVGDTPLIQVRCRFRGVERCIYVKYEAENFTGSIKDRMALHILESAYAQDEIRRGDLIIEATSGNTGISFAAIGRALGHDVRIYMPDWMSSERKWLLESLGATVVDVSAEEGGFVEAIARADREALSHGQAFRPRQFENRANVEAHRTTTGPELLSQLWRLGLLPSAFVAGVGTGGTLVGVGEHLRDRVDGVAIHPLEPANSPTLRTGTKQGTHRIQGISDDFVPAIVDLTRLDPVVDVWDGDAILMAQRLAQELGLAVGISSGANLLGAILVADAQGRGAVVATVFPDSNKKYRSTGLSGQEPILPEYISPEIELLEMRVIPRAGIGRAVVTRCDVA